MIRNLLALFSALAPITTAEPARVTASGIVLRDDVLNLSSPGIVQIGTSYRIPYSLLMANDTIPPKSLSATDPIIVDTMTGSGGNWGNNPTIEIVGFGPSNLCSPTGGCDYSVRDAQGVPIPGATARVTFTGAPLFPTASPDEATFANGTGPYAIDVLANDTGDPVFASFTPTDIQVLSSNGIAYATTLPSGSVGIVFEPSFNGCGDGIVQYRAQGCFDSSPTAATFHIGPPTVDCNSNCVVDALELDDDGDGTPNDCELGAVIARNDTITPDTPGVTFQNGYFRIPYDELLRNDTYTAGALNTTDPVIVDTSTGNGGLWDDGNDAGGGLGGDPVGDYALFFPSFPCDQSGQDCEYTLRDASGQPVSGVAFIDFVSMPTLTVANVDDMPFANDGGPYRIDVLANDTGFDPSFGAAIGFFGVTSGNGTAVLFFDSSLGRDVIEFRPDSEGCVDGVVRYRARGCTDSDPTTATFRIGPPLDDCNQNCLLDSTEPDDDGDGLPNDCDIKLGPCDVKRQVPGSLLLFPIFDNRDGNVTLATITNTNTSFLPGPGNQPEGTVDIEIVYIGRYGKGGQELACEESNTTHRLSPRDTLTLYTRVEDPDHELGFFYVFAKDLQSGAAIAWNHLIGELLFFSLDGDVEESLTALSFRSPLGKRVPTDVDGDGIRDLDGVEYDGAPEQVLIPRFLGQDPPGTPGGHADRLVLVALSGGPLFETVLDFTAYNDNEVPNPHDYIFRCWAAPLLADVSGAYWNEFLADNAGNDASEFLGAPAREYGWLRINGNRAFSDQDVIQDPAFYAVLFERIGAHVVVTPPFESCSQHNGDLYPYGLFAED